MNALTFESIAQKMGGFANDQQTHSKYTYDRLLYCS
jgi:hypothetical protein